MSKFWGKVIGGVLGFALGGGPLGAILGVTAGHAYDVRTGRNADQPMPTWINTPKQGQANARQTTFMNGVIVLGAKIAKADGPVTRAKIDAFKRAFSVKPQDEARIGRLFDNARRSPEGFEPYAFSLSQTFCNNPAILEEILSGLFLIAAAEKIVITPASAHFLKSVAFTFNFGPDDFQRIAARTGVRLPSEKETRDAYRETARDNASEPFAILGISDKATNDEIKAAYRTLIRQHHPDKLVSEGLPPEFIATATEKMKRINAAYDSVCKSRGIK